MSRTAAQVSAENTRIHAPQTGDSAVFRSPAELAQRVRNAALRLGFARVGFAPVEPFEHARRALRDWLDRDHHGEMAYMAAGPDRADPQHLLEGARTLIVVALPYAPITPLKQPNRKSLLLADVARYAEGADYHGIIKQKLRLLAEQCATFAGRPVLARPCVDTAPILEREAAARAGVGFTAKSTMTIVPGLGTQVLLGELLVDVEIAPDGPSTPRCGACTACIDACPTRAFPEPYVLDARRCISYLTIELRGPIPRALRPLIGNHVFGCDICQAVCPFNASARPKPVCSDFLPRPELADLTLLDLLELTSSGYRRLVRNSALRRASRTQLARNAAVALGNSGDPSVVPHLSRALSDDPRPLVRAHAAWALGRLGGSLARSALESAVSDADPAVAEEARSALSALANPALDAELS